MPFCAIRIKQQIILQGLGSFVHWVNNKSEDQQKMQISQNSNSSLKYSSLTYRPKTERYPTQASSQLTYSQLSSTRQKDLTHSSYTDINISRQHISFGRGYNDMKEKEAGKAKEQPKKTMQMSKVIVFKNLQQFEVSIQSQKGDLTGMASKMTAYGIATYRGVNKNVNSHQVGVHLGELTAFSLFQGYDGLIAASQLKKLYAAKLLEYFRKKRTTSREDAFQTAEESIRYSVRKSQEELTKFQEETADNSGTSLLSLVVHQNMIFCANCGCSSIFCLTSSGKMMSLAQPHTTDNPTEVDRIVKAGGQLYQTMVNIPYKQSMVIKGPLRVQPSGLTHTRTLGKSLSANKKKKYSMNQTENKGVLSTPEIKFIPASQVRWIVMLSSKIHDLVARNRIRDVIEQEMAKRSAVYDDSAAAEHVCKRVLLEAVEAGATESLTAILIVVNPQPHRSPQQPKKTDPPVQSPPILAHKPRSFRYIGNRANFVTPELPDS